MPETIFGKPNSIKDRVAQCNERFSNSLYSLFEKLLLRVSPRRKMKVLFSPRPEWEPLIRAGFKHTQHEIAFEAFSIDTIKAFDLVVPLSIQSLEYLQRHRALIDHLPIQIPAEDVVRLCEDKYLLNTFLINNGFGDIVPRMERNQYPYILKKRVDTWGENSHIILNAKDEQLFASILNDPEYFSQELIQGPSEYATHIIFQNNKIVSCLNVKYGFGTEIPIKGKDKWIYKKICRCQHPALFSSILRTIGFNGLCCLNYKICKNKLFLLEINPRFGGSLSPYFFSFLRHLN